MNPFIAAAAALALVTLALVLRPLFGKARTVETREQKDARLFRQQLAELDRDLERGVIRSEEAEGARAEISRRLIAATARAEAAEAPSPAPRSATRLVAGAALIGVPLLAALVYLANGAPGEPDRPFAERGLRPTIQTASGDPPPPRPSQAEAEAMAPSTMPGPAAGQEEFARLITQLEGVIAERGDDVEGLTLLANGYVRLGRHADAWPVFARLAAIQGEAAPADLYASQAEAMVLAAGGYVSPEAEGAIDEALAKEPGHPVARYYSGLAHAQAGRLDRAVRIWQALRDEAPEGAPWLAMLDEVIAEAEATRSGTAAPGPTSEQVEAAAGMSPEEREEMIEGMIARLEERLTTSGGEPEEWLRLMTSYTRLGRPDEARRAYELGRQALGPDGGASFLREQALVLGIIQE